MVYTNGQQSALQIPSSAYLLYLALSWEYIVELELDAMMFCPYTIYKLHQSLQYAIK